jgi:Ni,Fe-hydrogenase I small subunit
MLRGPNGSGKFHLMAGSGRPLTEWVARLARRARWVFAIGSCTAYGGFSANTPGNPLEACGLQYDEQTPGGLLGADFRSPAACRWSISPVARRIPAGWSIRWKRLALEGLSGQQTSTNSGGRCSTPAAWCTTAAPRNEYYEFKASAQKQSDLGCLMENLGCKGTQAHADCNLRPWNGSGSCLRGGFACIACTEPGFESPGHAFQETPKLAGIPIGLPTDMPKAWFVALAALSKSATPKRVRNNAVADHPVVMPAIRKKGGGK